MTEKYKIPPKDWEKFSLDRLLRAAKIFRPPKWADARISDLKRYAAAQIATMTAPHLMKFTFHETEPRLRAPADQIIEEIRGFSAGEQILVRVILDIWGDFGGVSLSDIIHRLGFYEFEAVTFALASLRERR